MTPIRTRGAATSAARNGQPSSNGASPGSSTVRATQAASTASTAPGTTRDQGDREQLGEQQPAGAATAAAAQPGERDLGPALLGDRQQHQPQHDHGEQAELRHQQRHRDPGLVDLVLDVGGEVRKPGEHGDRDAVSSRASLGELVDPGPSASTSSTPTALGVQRVGDRGRLAGQRGQLATVERDRSVSHTSCWTTGGGSSPEPERPVRLRPNQYVVLLLLVDAGDHQRGARHDGPRAAVARDAEHPQGLAGLDAEVLDVRLADGDSPAWSGQLPSTIVTWSH